VRFTENQVLNIIQEETKGCIREFVALGSEGPDGMVMLKTLQNVKIADIDNIKAGKVAQNVLECSTTQCAQFVSNRLKPLIGQKLAYQGNAWHAHKIHRLDLDSVFNDNAPRIAEKMANIFSALNKKGGKGEDQTIKALMANLVPPLDRWSDLPLGSVVGLYNPNSKYHSTAFFESATGRINLGQGDPAYKSLFFVREDNNQYWQPSDIGQDLVYKPSRVLTTMQRSFGPTTHVGIVGAKYGNTPIIFHNVGGNVHAAPLGAMTKDYYSIVWSKRI